MRATALLGMSGLGLVFWILLFTGLAGSVKIVELRVPQTVLNGTQEPTILDCDYVLEEGEKKEWLVVKWFFNRNPLPVYQWIYGKRPDVLGILKGRLDLSFKASEDDWSEHRALSIVNPTTELSGDWLCRVSSFKNDAMKAAKMIVFSPPDEMDIVLVSRPTPSSINISCWATGVFPEPKLTISYGSYQLTDVITEVSPSDGAFDVQVHKVLEDDELEPYPVIFDCELKIPNTSFVHRTDLAYGGPVDEPESSSSTCLTSSPFFGFFSALFLFVVYGLNMVRV